MHIHSWAYTIDDDDNDMPSLPELGMVPHTCDPSRWPEGRGSRFVSLRPGLDAYGVQGQPELHGETCL